MQNQSTKKGSCLCGNIQFTAHEAKAAVGACHCTMCRKWGGGPFMEINCGPNVTFENEHDISVFDSSDWAERGFCSNCGTHLFYRLKHSQQHFVPVGLFENDDDLVFDSQVFIDEKPHYYDFANDTSKMTGAELFAKFAPPSE